MPTWIERFLPPNPVARRLSFQSILFAIGQGAFLTGSAVFFTHIVGLTASQVGLGLTIAGLASFAFAVPLGRFADKVGTKRLWAVVVVHRRRVVPRLALARGLRPVRGDGGGARDRRHGGLHGVRGLHPQRLRPRGAGALPGVHAQRAQHRLHDRRPDRRSGARDQQRHGDPVDARSPGRDPRHQRAADHPASRGPGEVDASSDVEALVDWPKRPSVLRNRGYVAMSFFDGVLGTNQVLLNVVIPLWLVQETDAPRVLLAWLFGTNTVLAVLLQVPASRGSETVNGALRAARISTGFMVLSCFVVMVTHDTLGWTTILLVWLGHVTVTGAELFESAGHWGLTSELSEPARRAEYQGAGHVGGTLGSVWAPALFTFLAMEWGTTGWLLIAGIVVVAGIGIHPAARAAERYLATRTATAADQPA